MDSLLSLSTKELRELASGIRSGRLVPPFTALAVQRLVPNAADLTAQSLQQLAVAGLVTDHIALLIELLVRDRSTKPRLEEQVEVVTTGPDIPGVANRDTAVVVRELFANATSSVLVAGYAVHQGRQIFEALAIRVRDQPVLDVRLFLDIQRGPGDTSAPRERIHRFVEQFRSQHWPDGQALPSIFYDPRSLEIGGNSRACLHAKAVVVDQEHVFVSSANFTAAAQQRNIELGLLARSPVLAAQVVSFFDSLVSHGALVPVA